MLVLNPMTTFYYFFFSSSRVHPDLHSFPTRRSSDLVGKLIGRETSLVAWRSRQGSCLGEEFGSALVIFVFLLRSEEHTSELQSHHDLVCRLLLEKKKKQKPTTLNTNKLNT